MVKHAIPHNHGVFSDILEIFELVLALTFNGGVSEAWCLFNLCRIVTMAVKANNGPSSCRALFDSCYMSRLQVFADRYNPPGT